MFSNTTTRHMRFYNRAKKNQYKARNCFMGLCLLAICLQVVSFAGGCAVEEQVPSLKMNLNIPEINGKAVSLNGGVTAPVDRIQWEWGDGQTDKHHFFPASHTYASPGNYQITVTAFDNKNNSATRTASVEIK